MHDFFFLLKYEIFVFHYMTTLLSCLSAAAPGAATTVFDFFQLFVPLYISLYKVKCQVTNEHPVLHLTIGARLLIL